MKIHYWILGIILIVGYNAFLIKRDAEMFKAYYPESCQQQCTQEKGK
jgi:hypothetical protein